MPSSSPSAPVVFTFRAPRWGHLVALLAAGFLTAIFLRVLIAGLGELESPLATKDWPLAVGVCVGAAVGLFLCGVFAYRLFRNPPTLKILEAGFEYCPAGVSTGLIKWSDVVELRDESVLTSLVGQPGRRPVTAVVLRNPDDYVKQFPAALRPIFAVNRKLNSSPILITPGEFGADHDAIIAIMRENVIKAARASDAPESRAP